LQGSEVNARLSRSPAETCQSVIGQTALGRLRAHTRHTEFQGCLPEADVRNCKRSWLGYRITGGRPESHRCLRVLPEIWGHRCSVFDVFENTPNLSRRLDRGGKLLIELRCVPVNFRQRQNILRQSGNCAVGVLMRHQQQRPRNTQARIGSVVRDASARVEQPLRAPRRRRRFRACRAAPFHSGR